MATTEVAGTEASGDEAAELAKQLQNPVASLISGPLTPCKTNRAGITPSPQLHHEYPHTAPA
jgi:hypothetical protein